MKENSDNFADILYEVFNRSLEVGTFPSSMKSTKVTPNSRSDKEVMELSVYYLIY